MKDWARLYCRRQCVVEFVDNFPPLLTPKLTPNLLQIGWPLSRECTASSILSVTAALFGIGTWVPHGCVRDLLDDSGGVLHNYASIILKRYLCGKRAEVGPAPD